MKVCMSCGSLTPGSISIPEATSTPHGCTCLIAGMMFSGVNPPAKKIRVSRAIDAACSQSAMCPAPPYLP